MPVTNNKSQTQKGHKCAGIVTTVLPWWSYTKNRFMRILLIASAITLVLSSCRFLGGERVEGNGHITTQQRNAGRFDGVDASGAVEVRLRQDAATSVRVETDENLQEYIDVHVEGGTLVVEPEHGFSLDPSRKIVVYASAPDFKTLEVSGASHLISDAPLNGDRLQVIASGASEVKLDVKLSKLETESSGASVIQYRGSAATVSTQASGASKIRCMDLATDETTLDLSGACNAEVTATKQLNIEASGASDVRYRGNANVNQKSTGASSVQKVS
jgi:hypothetical protein